jgi:hypothetical protein
MASRKQEMLGKLLDRLQGEDTAPAFNQEFNLNTMYQAYNMKRALGKLNALEAMAKKGDANAINLLVQIAKGPPVF